MCQNRTCFGQKTQAALAEKKAALSDDFNVVVLATEKPDSECLPLLKEGSAGVGRKQFSACQQCAHFGARIEDRLNGKTGEVAEGMCFNRKCNSEKVAAYQAALKADQDAEASASPAAGGGSKAAISKATKPKAGEKAGSADLPKAAKIVISRQIRGRLPEIVNDNRSLQLALLLDALAHYTGRSSKVVDGIEGLPDELVASLSRGSDDLVGKIAGFDADVLAKAVRSIVCALPVQESVGNQGDWTGWATPQMKRAVKMAEVAGRDRGDLFEVDADFLSALPKAAIESLLDEVGFKSWFLAQEGDDREKAYKQMMALKKAELPEAIMSAGFDWKGIIPSQVAGFAGWK
jgi:hypothetical protein